MVPEIGSLNLTSRRIERVQTGSLSRIALDISFVALSAGFYTLASPPYDWSLLGWLALTPLFLAIRGKSLRLAALYGTLFGVLICAGVAHWMYSAISNYFVALFPLDLILTVLSFTIFVGIYTGATSALWSILMRRAEAVGWLGIPALWVVCEYARSTFLSGFSWCLLGYAQHGFPIVIQLADITGVYGVSFLMACSSYVVAELYFVLSDGSHQSRNLVNSFSFTAIALVATLGYGAVRLHQYRPDSSQPTLRVTIVEHDVPAQERWNRIKYLSSLLNYARLTREGVKPGSVDMVVWPEFAAQLYVDQDPSVRLQLSSLTAAIDTPLLLGAPRMENANRYNSAYLLAADGAIVDTYDKMRLLPFAEYHPLGLPSFINRSSEVPDEFAPGTRATIFAISRARFGVIICYEATYPEYARRLTRRGAQLLVNLSNDVWLSGAGGEAAAQQHFAMAIFRAVENKRAIVRATMSGITGYIDEVGHPFHLAQGTDTVTSDVVPIYSELTIYTRVGDWFVALCAMYSALCLIAALRSASLS